MISKPPPQYYRDELVNVAASAGRITPVQEQCHTHTHTHRENKMCESGLIGSP